MNFVATKQLEEQNQENQPKTLPEKNAWVYVGEEPFFENIGFEVLGVSDFSAGLDLKAIKGVVYGGALGADAIALDTPGQKQVTDLIFTHIVDIISRSPSSGKSFRLFILTQGAFSLPKDSGPMNLIQGAMEGLVQVVYNERPNLGIKLIDLDPDIPLPDQITAVQGEILKEEDKEDVVAFRRGQRFVKRCESISRPRQEFRFDPLDDHKNTHVINLTVDSPGTLEGLCLETIARGELGPDEVEIRVEAAGINFRDLLKVLGVYPTEVSDSKLLGDECAGVIMRTGEGVTAFSKGDRVAAIGLGCFKTHLILMADRLIKLPDSMGSIWGM